MMPAPTATTAAAALPAYSHSVRALILSSPTRYERAAAHARRAGFTPELVHGLYGQANRCWRGNADVNTSRAQRHAVVDNTKMNMIEGFRRLARIVVERGTAHALFEDDIVLATSRDEVQRFLAQRAGQYSHIPLGGCLVPGKNRTNPNNALLTCGHATYWDPAFAAAYLRLTDACATMMSHGLDGAVRSRLCESEGSRSDQPQRQRRLRCAHWEPLLSGYQGAGWLPRQYDLRCARCRSSSSTAEEARLCPCENTTVVAAHLDRQSHKSTAPKYPWLADRHGWVGFGHFVQDRFEVHPHLHDMNNMLRKTHRIRAELQENSVSVARADAG